MTPNRAPRLVLLLFGLAAALACGPSDGSAASSQAAPGEIPDPGDREVAYTEAREPCADFAPHRKALFGDLHVHTRFSFDAAANSTGATPADAYRYAKGEAIPFFPIGEDGAAAGTARIDRPLDFLGVTDHGEFLGERRLCREPGSPSYDTAFCRQTRTGERVGMVMLAQVITTEDPQRVAEICGEDGALCREWAEQPWSEIAAAAEEAYDRSAECSFTSFVGYEYTGTPGTSNLHRNVLFRNDRVPEAPVSYIEAPTDSQLWSMLDRECRAESGCEYLTIPHNSNLANGRMAPYTKIERTPESRRAYAQARERREPILEIFQHKGGSECINGLSSVLGAPDELCNVEQVRTMGREETYAVPAPSGDGSLVPAKEITRECEPEEIGENGMLGAGCVHATDFLRSGLLVGLEEERELGANPMKLGVIASTDTHTATAGGVSETDWRGHVTGEATPAERLQPGLLTSGIDGNPGGLAGVWAVENSRDAIFEAMQRREVFGTSGPRIAPRFFGGWDYAADACEDHDLLAMAYMRGVPMGGDLPPAPSDAASAGPAFVAWAARDPADDAAPLQQLQVIKGWVDDEGRHTEVITVAGSPDNGATVDPETGERRGDGHDTLCAVWRDPDFDPEASAYYYLRVVENPSPRWSFFDCRRLAPEDRPPVCSDGSYPHVLREMAWSSPIWYRP